MKQFFGAFFGSIIGIVVAILLAVILVIATVKSSINSAFKDKNETSSTMKENSVIKLVIDGDIVDREKENPFEDFGDMAPFGGMKGHGLNILLKKIRSAKNDDQVKGIFLVIKDLRGGFATVEELREALIDFKSGGKFIYAYSENYSHKEYYLASAGSKVFLNPQGSLDWRGLSMNLMFFKQTFEKLDLDVQIFRHGKYKSAVEPFMLDKMSASNRLQSETFLNSIWSSMTSRIAADRKISEEELNRMADQLEIKFPEDAVGKLVDEAAYEDQVVEQIKKLVGVKEDDKMKFTDFNKYDPENEGKINTDKIAVIYATGGISSGEGGDEEIGSDRLAKTIREARMDDKVKAIVLRVNSPGGSALASDVIWREMVLAKAAKPTVVSMGDLAASGGYYISCAADRIFAQPNTITGSIGVFGIIPSFQRMLNSKFGISIDTVNTNKFSDLGALRPLTQKESEFVQVSVERVYSTFTSRVAEGRKIDIAQVDSIGQGRVWTGKDALQLKLVDELGGLSDAIAYAAGKAKLKDYKVSELPKQKNPFDALLGKSQNDFESRMMKHQLGEMYFFFSQVQNLMKMEGVQMRLPFSLMID